MAEEKSDTGINPDMSEDEDSDDEVSLLVVDEDELQTALETAGISVKVCCSSSSSTSSTIFTAHNRHVVFVPLPGRGRFASPLR